VLEKGGVDCSASQGFHHAHYGDGTEDCLAHLGLAAQIINITRNQIGAKLHSA
jgi:hypothetical protein